MTISLFSGQGSQYPGMGKDIAEAFPEVSAVYETGSAILGKDLKEICFSAPAEELSRTINAQPAIMAASIVCLTAAQTKGFRFDGVAGHSLGEYAAMYASGMISLEDAFRLIKARAEAMEEATAQTKGAMAAVMKIEPSKVEEVCANAKAYAAAVNYNSPVQTVIAGTPEGIEEVSAVFKELKARVVPLNVAGAFHSELMKPAADKFYETAKTIEYKAPPGKILFKRYRKRAYGFLRYGVSSCKAYLLSRALHLGACRYERSRSRQIRRIRSGKNSHRACQKDSFRRNSAQYRKQGNS